MSITRQALYSGSGITYALIIDSGEPIPLEAVTLTDHGVQGAGTLLQGPRQCTVEVATAGTRQQGITGSSTVREYMAELDRVCTERDAFKKMVAARNADIDRLREWLSGVQPVQDPDVPGRYWCGVCARPWDDHAADCPADAGV